MDRPSGVKSPKVSVQLLGNGSPICAPACRSYSRVAPLAPPTAARRPSGERPHKLKPGNAVNGWGGLRAGVDVDEPDGAGVPVDDQRHVAARQEERDAAADDRRGPTLGGGHRPIGQWGADLASRRRSGAAASSRRSRMR